MVLLSSCQRNGCVRRAQCKIIALPITGLPGRCWHTAYCRLCRCLSVEALCAAGNFQPLHHVRSDRTFVFIRLSRCALTQWASGVFGSTIRLYRLRCVGQRNRLIECVLPGGKSCPGKPNIKSRLKFSRRSGQHRLLDRHVCIVNTPQEGQFAGLQTLRRD